MTDYPDEIILGNLRNTVERNRQLYQQPCVVHCEGYEWGTDVSSLLLGPHVDLGRSFPPYQKTEYTHASFILSCFFYIKIFQPSIRELQNRGLRCRDYYVRPAALPHALTVPRKDTRCARVRCSGQVYRTARVPEFFWIRVHAWDWYGTKRAVHPSMSMREQRTRRARGWWLAWTRRNLPSARVCARWCVGRWNAESHPRW